MTRFTSHTGFRIRGDDAGLDRNDRAAYPAPDVVFCSSGYRSHLAHSQFAFASISSNMFGPKPMEPSTHQYFPNDLCHNQKPCPSLTGLGVRSKRILGIKNINIYAVGVYVDPAAAKKALGCVMCPIYAVGVYVDPAAAKKALGSKFSKETTAQDLAHNQALFDEVVNNASFEKSLRLVISFGALKRDQFVDALEERLLPALKTYSEPDSTLESFEKMFDDVSFQKGLEIVFAQDGSNLTTTIGGKKKGVINSPALCRSLFGVYLGPDAVAPKAKSTFGQNLATALLD
eukprot:gene15761-21883_t